MAKKIDVPAGWGGPVILTGDDPKARSVRPINRDATDEEKDWYVPIGMMLRSTVDRCSAQRPEFSHNLEFLHEHCRAAAQAYAFGEESAENALRYTRSVMSYFGMPEAWRWGFLGIVGEAIATATPRSAAKKKGESDWMANNCAALVEYHIQQGMKQTPAVKAALTTLAEMGLPSTAKIDTVKSWHRQYRASLGLPPMPPGRPSGNPDFPPT